MSERTRGHETRIAELSGQRDALETKANRISLFRLLTFFAAAAALVAGLKQATPLALPFALALGLLFFVAVALHARVLSGQRAIEVRLDVHRRQLKRITGDFADLPSEGRGLLEPSHPYSSDIDLVGPGSLFQRIDVSQTHEGERALARALAEPASLEVILARQQAVRELSERAAFREEIETLGALHQQRGQKLDHGPFMALFAMAPVFGTRPWLKPLALALLATTLSCLVLVQLDQLPTIAIWSCVVVQGLLLWSLREPVHGTLDMLTARLGFAQAYLGMISALEQERFAAPHLVALQTRLRTGAGSASTSMAKLARYESYGQLRTQGPLYIVVNLLTLWDLFCLERIERFVKEASPRCEDWFRVIGELELLCSLATLCHVDEHASFPTLSPHESGLVAEGLVHPLLPASARVPNDVSLPGPGSALIITGSNMAGKSTLLRALGLNVALALAGGPVCARSFRLPLLRLRASMRIDDSLQRGASYFHAELTRLRSVVAELESGPHVLFLLDELLRGTNAHARHQGARAVLLHLLKRGALGLVATHDVALSELEAELSGRVQNVHFTDVFQDGEMRFDYRLREGVVKTSNALRLLAMAGIELDETDVRIA